jgi:hypothetical protein
MPSEGTLLLWVATEKYKAQETEEEGEEKEK